MCFIKNTDSNLDSFPFYLKHTMILGREQRQFQKIFKTMLFPFPINFVSIFLLKFYFITMPNRLECSINLKTRTLPCMQHMNGDDERPKLGIDGEIQEVAIDIQGREEISPPLHSRFISTSLTHLSLRVKVCNFHSMCLTQSISNHPNGPNA